MLTEIAVADIIEVVDSLRAREKANCEQFVKLNPVHKEVRERERFIYDAALHDIIHELRLKELKRRAG